jgi:ribonuclease J
MRVRIHRGAHEIGGTCVEVESGADRLVLDIGAPLEPLAGEPATPPPVPGLTDGGDGSIRGLLISHPHQDHYGLVGDVHSDVPIYIGEAAAAILAAAAFFSPASARLTPAGYLAHRRPLELGRFRVTPYLADHSAFDSYSLLVEAGGRRLFYSGDIRGHGRKAAVFEELLREAPSSVDVALLEGTRVGRPSDDSDGELDESALEVAMAGAFRDAPGLVLVYASAQNIDRLVTVYRACLRADRVLVVDLYGATIARASGRETIPQPGFPSLRVYVPQRQRVLVKKSAEFHRVDELGRARIFQNEMRGRAGELVALLPASATAELARVRCLTDARAIWSLWPGYLDQPSGQRLVALLARHDVPLDRLHASGHASVAQLGRLVEALAPDRVVPIHTSAPELFASTLPRVERQDDGEWWTV